MTRRFPFFDFAARTLSSEPLTRRTTIRTLIGSGALALALLAGSTLTPVLHQAQATVPQSLSAAQKAVLEKAEKKLSSVHTLLAQFEQVSSNGAIAKGTVAIKRPGKMRLDYDPPAQIKVIADGTHLIYIDQELDQVSYIGLDSTPAGILLRDKVSFNDPDIAVTAVREEPGVAEIDVIMSNDPGAGKLTLIFATSPFELRQWKMHDAQGVTTTVSLNDVTLGIPLADGRFHYVKKPRSVLDH